MAYYDPLTGLPNRNSMKRFMKRQNPKDYLGVLFIDINQFRVLSDTLGHELGENVLREISMQLRQFNDENQQLFRLGEDEFLFAVTPCNLEQAKNLAENILQSIGKVRCVEENEVYTTVSIGISHGALMYTNVSELLKEADAAMQQARSLGENQYYIYNEKMDKKRIWLMEVEKDLRIALENNRFHLVYQPKWDVEIDNMFGFESLLRWEHPRLGMIPPGEFIPIAEKTGAIIPITDWVLEKACLQCKAWYDQGVYQPVSVNISGRLFRPGILAERVQSILAKVGLPPHLLELEITESLILHNMDEVTSHLKKLRHLGVKVSLDDFGTGYSSISLLDQIPIDIIKLDKSFIRDIETPPKRAIIDAIITMAENLKLDIVAEGVENQAHVDTLVQLGCNKMQGYFYSKPMSIDQLGASLTLAGNSNQTEIKQDGT